MAYFHFSKLFQLKKLARHALNYVSHRTLLWQVWKPLAPLTSITGAVGGNALKYLSAVISALSTGNGPFTPRQGCTIRSIAVTRQMQAATFLSPACTLLSHTLFERYLQFLKLPTDLLPGIDRVWILTGLDKNTTTGSRLYHVSKFDL